MQKQETDQFIQTKLTQSNALDQDQLNQGKEYLQKDALPGEIIDNEQESNQEVYLNQYEVKNIQQNKSYLSKQVVKQSELKKYKNIELKKQTSNHMQLEIEYPQQQFNFQEENKFQQKKEDKKNNSMLICIQDAQVIPTVYLQSSPKGQKFISIKIPMYRTTTFLKLETQIFILDVKKPGSLREYQIERRYSDFVDLYQSLFYNQPGYILAPFPDKGVESFIKIKLGIGTSQPGERQQMIEKRMLDLEKFINFITHHQELSNSEQLVNFITQDQSVFQQGKKRLQKYVYENRSIEKSSQIKNIIGLGKNLWTSYFKNGHKQQKIDQSTISIGKNDIEFGIILETVKTQKQKTQQKYNQFLKMYMAQKSFSQFVDMPTENDFLLKLCAKHASGKQESKQFATFLEIQVLDQYRYNIKQFQEVEKILLYRIQIWECLEEAKKEKNKGKKQKLARRLEMFERNFLTDWENIFVTIQKKNKKIYSKFLDQWSKHKKFMKKLWRH